MTRKQIDMLGLSILVLMFSFVIISARMARAHLMNHRIITNGKLTGYSFIKGGQMSIEYRFIVPGGQYKSSNAFTAQNMNDFRNHFLFEWFPVIYYDKNPRTSLMLISPETFKAYRVPFPDSLKWELKYLKPE